MKKEVIGRRFTKRIRERFSDAAGDDMREALDRLVEAAPTSVTLADRLTAGLTAARAQLHASGLPDAPLLHWTRGVIEPLTGQAAPAARAWTLPAFIEARGFEADSREGLAAAIVWAEHVTRTATGTDRDAALLDLGGLFALADVYAQYEPAEATARSNAQKPRAGRQKVTPELLSEYEALKESQEAGAAGILAKRHNVTARTIRQAAQKKRERSTR